MVYEFKLPDVGEGVAEGEILKWMVKEGATVTEGEPILEVMTDKVNVKIPAPRSGKVSSILVKEGGIARVGQTILIIDDGSISPPPTPTPSKSSPIVSTSPAPQARADEARPAPMATPATRKLARELHVDLFTVTGSGPQGRITEDDVKRAAAKSALATETPPAQKFPSPKTEGMGELVPLRGIRKMVAEHMSRSKDTVAQVTHVDEADMTELVLLREAFKPSAERRGVKLTYVPFVIKALVPALKEFPYVNASLDEQTGNIILKKYYNIGVATDTEQGLVVPVLKDADKKDIFELAGEIERLASRARSGQLSLDEVKGSTFTITNLGSIGGTFATPIINYPEVAILGLYRIGRKPMVRDGKIEVRDTTYLSLGFDHRVLDGAYAARFMARLIEIIQDTKSLLAEVL